jgi:serine protease
MMTDQNPAGGWTNHTTSSYSGEENADECAWLSSGQGAAANVTFGTGTFALQSSWSNDTNRCDLTHAIVGGGGSTGNTVSVTNPGSQSGTVGTATSLQIHASDSSSSATLSYSATGLPTGLSINSSTGLISGTPSAAGTFSVTATATDNTGAAGSAGFTWTIASSTGGGCSGQLFKNPGFESGSTYWSSTSGVINTDGAYSHSGMGYAWLDGYGTTHTDTLSQSITIPAGCSATLSYYLWIDSAEGTTYAYDKLTVTANGTKVQAFSNVNQGSGYVKRSVSLSAYAGQTVTVKWTGTEDYSLATSFLIDDTAVTLS